MNFFFLRLFLGLFFCGGFLHSIEKVEIALVQDGPFAESSPYISLIQKEITSLLEDEFEVSFSFYNGNWTYPSVKIALEAALENPTVSLVISTGFFSNELSFNLEKVSKPLLIPTFIDRTKDPLSKKAIALISPKDLKEELALFSHVFSFSSLGIIGDSSFFEEEEGEESKDFFKNSLPASVKPIFLPIKETASPVIQKIQEERPAALLFIPTFRLPKEELLKIIDFTYDKKIPSFTVIGESEVADGVLMGIYAQNFFKRMARKIALTVLDVVSHEPILTTERQPLEKEELVINEATLKKLNLDLPLSLMKEIRFIKGNSKERDNNPLTLAMTQRLTLLNNLDLDAERFFVKTVEEDYERSKSFLGPRLVSQAAGVAIDADSARIARGTVPQYTFSGGLSLHQQIYKEDRFANVYVQGKRVQSSLYNEERDILDISLSAFRSYLRILRLHKEVLIAQENVSLSRANLKRAEYRVASGEAVKSEIYRWQSQIANSEDTLLRLVKNLKIEEVELNRILNRPLEAVLNLKDFNPLDLISENESYGLTLKEIETYKEKLLAIGLKGAPEIASLQEEIEAKERRLLEAERAFYLPEFGAQAGIDDVFAKGGAGSKLAPGIKYDYINMLLKVDVTFPLYTSGQREADLKRAFYEVRRFKIEKESVEERVQKRILDALDDARRSYQAIFLSKASKEAAEKNLKIVADSYERGVINIVDLLDAQNNTFTAKLSFSNSFYDFLTNMLELERSIGRFNFFFDSKEIPSFADWIEAIIGENVPCRK